MPFPKPPATLDEAPPEPPVVEEQAPTRYVRPYRDHGVESPMARSPSASQMALQAAAVPEAEDGVRGTLAQAVLDGGDFTIRLAHASASMRALAQLLAAQGLEVEIVVVRRRS